jgi:hypothetical protein
MKYSKTLIISTMMAGILCGAGAVASNADAEHPSTFTTKNYTPYRVNIKVGDIWSPFPTPPGTADAPSENAAPWVSLRLLCGLTSTECHLKFYVKSDTAHPVHIGDSSINMETGELTKKYLTKDGFVLKSPEAAVVEITGK